MMSLLTKAPVAGWTANRCRPKKFQVRIAVGVLCAALQKVSTIVLIDDEITSAPVVIRLFIDLILD